MIIRKEIDISKPLSVNQIEMLEKMESRPITADSDYPECSEEELRQLMQIAAERRAGRQKQTVALRI